MKWSPSSSLNLIMLKVPAFDLLVISTREHIGMSVAYSETCETIIKQIEKDEASNFSARVIDKVVNAWEFEWKC